MGKASLPGQSFVSVSRIAHVSRMAQHVGWPAATKAMDADIETLSVLRNIADPKWSGVVVQPKRLASFVRHVFSRAQRGLEPPSKADAATLAFDAAAAEAQFLM